MSRDEDSKQKVHLRDDDKMTEEIFIRNLRYTIRRFIESLHVGDVDAVPRRSRHDRRVHLLLVLKVHVLLDDAGAETRDRRLRNRREHRSHSPPIGSRPRGRHQAPPEVEIRENRKRSSYNVSTLQARIRTTGARRQTLNGERSVVDPAARCRGRCRRR